MLNMLIKFNSKEKSKRLINLERELTIAGFNEALRSLKLVERDMSKEKGYLRHDGSAYLTHIYDVALHLLDSGYKSKEHEKLIIGAILHDYVEDVPGATVLMVEELFGDDVAKYVGDVTKKKGINYKEDLEEFQRYLEQILGERYSALIKVADRICNFRTLSASTDEHRAKQLKETAEWFIPFIKEARRLYTVDEAFYYQALSILRPLISEVDRNQKLLAENKALKEEVQKLREQLDKK